MSINQTIYNVTGHSNTVINGVTNSSIIINKNPNNYSYTSKYSLLEFKLLLKKGIKKFLEMSDKSSKDQVDLLNHPNQIIKVIEHAVKLEKLNIDCNNKEKFLEVLRLKLINDLNESLVTDTHRATIKIFEDSVPIFGRDVRNKLRIFSREHILDQVFSGQQDLDLINFICEKGKTINLSCACNSVAAFAVIENMSHMLPIKCSFKEPYGREQFKKASSADPFDFIIVGNPAFFFSNPQMRDEYQLILPLHLESCSLLSSTKNIKRKYYAGHSATHSSHLLINNKVEAVEIEPISLLTADEMLLDNNVGFYVWEPLSLYYKDISGKTPYIHSRCEHVISLFVRKDLYESDPRLVKSFVNIFISNWIKMKYNIGFAEDILLQRNDYLKAFYSSSGFLNIEQ